MSSILPKRHGLTISEPKFRQKKEKNDIKESGKRENIVPLFSKEKHITKSYISIRENS